MSCLARIFLALVVLFFLFPRSALASDNLLLNADFEESTSSSFPGWSKTPSTLALSVASISGLTHNGSFAARFRSQSTSTKYLYQVIPLPSGFYKFSAWLRLLTGNQSGFLRLSWYPTTDGSGSEIASADSPVIAIVGDWQKIEVTAEAPPSAQSLRAKLTLDPSSSEINELIYDEVILEKAASVTPLSFSITLPSDIQTGEEFSLTVDLKGLSDNTKYFLKVLGGQKSKLIGELFDFYTWSPSKNTFLAWNASWSDFPTLTSDLSGAATITIKGKFTSDGFIGENKVVIRLRKEGATTNLDSDGAPITVFQSNNEANSFDNEIKEPAIPGPYLTASKTTVTSLDPVPETTFFLVEDVTSSPSGSVLAAAISPPSPITLVRESKLENTSHETNNAFPWEIPLITVGAILLGFSTIIMIIKAGGWHFLKGIFVSD